jgi:DNA processing protein
VNRRSLTLALSQCPGIGSKTIVRIHTRNDLYGRSPDEFLGFPEPVLVEEYKLRPQVARKWAAGRRQYVREAAEIEAGLRAGGVKWVTLADAHYPSAVEQMVADAPGVLYLYGNEKLLQAQTACVLASRDAAPEALQEVERLSEEHVFAGRTLVSGHDTAAYQRAAVVPLRFGAPRILVLDRGFYAVLGERLDQEPFAAARLWRFCFDPHTDLVVSAVAPAKEFHRNSNQVRDRLVAGLSLSMDVAWARPGGMMERMAKAALVAGRPVRVSERAPAAGALTALGAVPIPYSFVS